MSETDRQIEREKRKLAGHNVPRAGTLAEMSYCRDCGASFTSTEKCTGPDGIVRNAAYYRENGL